MNPPRAAVPLIFLIPALLPPSPVEFLMLILRVWPIPMGFSLHGVTTSPSPSAPRKPSQVTANIHVFFELSYGEVFAFVFSLLDMDISFSICGGMGGVCWSGGRNSLGRRVGMRCL